MAVKKPLETAPRGLVTPFAAVFSHRRRHDAFSIGDTTSDEEVLQDLDLWNAGQPVIYRENARHYGEHPTTADIN
jgi:hypothetical protein